MLLLFKENLQNNALFLTREHKLYIINIGNDAKSLPDIFVRHLHSWLLYIVFAALP